MLKKDEGDVFISAGNSGALLCRSNTTSRKNKKA